MFTRTIARHRLGRGEITITHELPTLQHQQVSMRSVRTNIRFTVLEMETEVPHSIDLGADGESWFTVASPVSVLIRAAQAKANALPRRHWFRYEIEEQFIQWLAANRQYIVKLATTPPRIIEEHAP